MRGSQEHADWHGCVEGIIPAHAGLTFTPPYKFRHCRDHPRACGAHQDNNKKVWNLAGSSPRMRGSPGYADRQIPAVGIIPAHAGLTDYECLRCGRARDHPRACGAHFVWPASRAGFWGSSPRMRGSLEYDENYNNVVGIIPAHAGLTQPKGSAPCSVRDHPRACGAHYTSRAAKRKEMGSSPRMRGSRASSGRSLSRSRIIPAHAGLTRPI